MCFLHLLANYWGDHLRKIYDFHPFRSFIDFMKLLASETSRYVFVKTKYVWLQPAPFQAIPSVITIKEVWIESNIYKHDHGKKNSNKEHCNLESICITTHLHPHPRLHTQIQLGDYIYIYNHRSLLLWKAILYSKEPSSIAIKHSPRSSAGVTCWRLPSINS